MGGWLEIWRVKLISTQVVVEVELELSLVISVFEPYTDRFFSN